MHCTWLSLVQGILERLRDIWDWRSDMTHLYTVSHLVCGFPPIFTDFWPLERGRVAVKG